MTGGIHNTTMSAGSRGTRSVQRPSAYHPVKRCWDVLVAGLTLLALLPVLFLIAIAIKITTPGPVLFVQHRIGQGGRLFPFFKFRTMVDGAHLARADVLGQPDEEMADRYRHDPRVTRVGAALRRWSIDELPQLANIVAGHMSIVGPRPMLAEEAHLLRDEDHRRHDAKPGLTGLWQVSGRKETSWDERMALDVEYVEGVSPAMDFKIVARTARVVVSGEGAY